MERGKKMETKIIQGSKQWGKVVPDEHAIKCVHMQTEGTYKILKFTYVKSVRNTLGAGFEKVDAVALIPASIEGVLISRTDNFPIPDIYHMNNGKLSFVGTLDECEIEFPQHDAPEFNKVFHYSRRAIERQKSDENAPEWLKKFAGEHSSNCAYFEF